MLLYCSNSYTISKWEQSWLADSHARQAGRRIATLSNHFHHKLNQIQYDNTNLEATGMVGRD